MQYSSGVAAFAVYLTQYQQLPYQRTADFLRALAGIALSPATLHTMVLDHDRRVLHPL